MPLTTETKVGLFTLSGLFVFALGIIVLGDFQFHGTYPLYVYFDNALGLPEKGPVKVAGVEVGQVERIELDNQRARVKVRMRNTIEVHHGTKAQVASTGFIGSKYLEMTLGDPNAPVLSAGDSIEGTPTFTFDEIMGKLGTFFKDDPAQGAAADNLRVTIANFRKVSQTLADSLGNQRAELTEIVQNIRDLSAHAKSVAADLHEITGEKKEDIKITLSKLPLDLGTLGPNHRTRVQNGEGLLGRLVNDPELGKNLDQTMVNVNKATTDIKSFTGALPPSTCIGITVNGSTWKTGAGIQTPGSKSSRVPASTTIWAGTIWGNGKIAPWKETMWREKTESRRSWGMILGR
jgi:phospholipid/cholesterol/gamma-HCH transport system substrate-binding protein